MSISIHPTSIVEAGAVIDPSSSIGPFCHVGPHVKLQENVVLHSHVVVSGHTILGSGTEVFPFASVGNAPQDLKFQGEDSFLEIGKNCKIREHVTINPGTQSGGNYTRIGDNCLIMIGCHIAHDCQIGNNVILVNNTTLAGHVIVEDFVIIGGVSAVHQFVRIGKHAFIGGQSGVEYDVIPYGSALGNRAQLGGLNITGLRRHQFPREDIHAIRRAYKELFSQKGSLSERAAEMAKTYADNPRVMTMLNFVLAESKRGFHTPRDAGTFASDDSDG